MSGYSVLIRHLYVYYSYNADFYLFVIWSEQIYGTLTKDPFILFVTVVYTNNFVFERQIRFYCLKILTVQWYVLPPQAVPKMDAISSSTTSELSFGHTSAFSQKALLCAQNISSYRAKGECDHRQSGKLNDKLTARTGIGSLD
jgi:hypothetical protein